MNKIDAFLQTLIAIFTIYGGVHFIKDFVHFILKTIGNLKEIRERKNRLKKFPPHVCDQLFDGMCVQCQINSARIIVDALSEKKLREEERRYA